MMKSDDIMKLLGGYATGTLTEQERASLFEAAIGNQELFDALADEEALRELLSDPVCRQQLLRSLGEKKLTFGERVTMWLRRPATLALAGGLTAAAIGVVVIRNVYGPAGPVQEIAMRHQTPAMPAPPPATKAQPPQPETKKESKVQAPRPKKREAVVPATPASESKPLEKPATQASSRELRDQRQAQAEADVLHERSGQAVRSKEAREAAPAVAFRTSVRNQAPSLRYTVERRNVEGVYSEVLASTTFALSDSLRLTVEPGISGHLYVMRAGLLLYEQQVTEDVRYTIPPEGSLPAPIQPGETKLRLIVSREPLAVRTLAAGRLTVTPVGQSAAPSSQVTVEVNLTYK
jgi:hypothetical protein